ncbi:MAG: hypothetical protein ACR2FN_10350 [Chitinophagaceae bacterium]
MKTSINAKHTTIGNSQGGHHYWVGLCGNGIDYYAGQTFKTPEKGILKKIQIFPEMIVGETDALISVFEFDEKQRSWKEKKAESRLLLDKTMENKWIEFEMNNVMLDNEKNYAFKISCNHGGMMAIAECSWKQIDPYPDGIEWIGSSENPEGRFHPNFDLAFIAEIENN